MSVSGRAQASKLAPTDSKAPFAVAERIEDPWYAAQAFATVARHAHGPIRAKAFAASRAAARRGKDTYQQAAVLAWPLRAAIELGEEKLAEAIFVDASALLPAINNFSSRAQAFDLVFQAAFPGGAKLWRPLLDALPRLCPADSHWRAARMHREIVWILARDHINLARDLAEALPEGRTRRQALRDLANGVKSAPRMFFFTPP